MGGELEKGILSKLGSDFLVSYLQLRNLDFIL